MKKSVILLALITTLVACKKSENSVDSNEAVSISSESTSDSAIVNSGESFKISKEEIEKIQKKTINETQKSIDSIAKSERKELQIIDETPPDSVVGKIIKKEAQPKIIKQTKIIYKEKQEKISSKPSEPIIKSGNLSFNVEDNVVALNEVKYLIKKYDGTIKAENFNSNGDYQTNYISAKIPLRQYDYLIEDLIYKIGNTTERNLEISGENYNGNKLCDIEITLYNNNPNKIKNIENQNFAEKTWSSFSKGWEAIGKIFLFFLPFWPIFIILGFAYYYFIKKKDSDENQS